MRLLLRYFRWKQSSSRCCNRWTSLSGHVRLYFFQELQRGLVKFNMSRPLLGEQCVIIGILEFTKLWAPKRELHSRPLSLSSGFSVPRLQIKWYAHKFRPTESKLSWIIGCQRKLGDPTLLIMDQQHLSLFQLRLLARARDRGLDWRGWLGGCSVIRSLGCGGWPEVNVYGNSHQPMSCAWKASQQGKDHRLQYPGSET